MPKIPTDDVVLSLLYLDKMMQGRVCYCYFRGKIHDVAVAAKAANSPWPFGRVSPACLVCCYFRVAMGFPIDYFQWERKPLCAKLSM